MDIASAPATDPSPYPALFREYVLRSAQQNLMALESEQGRQEWPLLERAVHSLGYVLKLDSGWATARELLLTLSPALERTGLRDEWTPYLTRGVQHSVERADWATAAELLLQLGLLHQLVGEYEQAVENYRKADIFFGKIGDDVGQCRARLKTAFVAYLNEERANATRLAHEALKLLPPRHPEMANAFRILGHVSRDSGDIRGTVDHFSNALDIVEAAGDQRNLARCLRDLGPALFQIGDVDNALRIQHRAVRIFKKLGDTLQRSVTEMNIGVLHHYHGDIDVALKYYWLAEPTIRQLNDMLHLALLYGNVGEALRDKREWDAASHYTRMSVDHWRRIGNSRQLIDRSVELGRIYIEQENFNGAQRLLYEAQTLVMQFENDRELQEKLQTTISKQLNRLPKIGIRP